MVTKVDTLTKTACLFYFKIRKCQGHFKQYFLRNMSCHLFVQVPGKAVAQQKMMAYISFTNPLPVPLKDGVFTVEGAGLLRVTEIHVQGTIAPGKKVSVRHSFSPIRVGVRKLLVDFDSDRLKDVKGVATVVVRKKKC